MYRAHKHTHIYINIYVKNLWRWEFPRIWMLEILKWAEAGCAECVTSARWLMGWNPDLGKTQMYFWLQSSKKAQGGCNRRRSWAKHLANANGMLLHLHVADLLHIPSYNLFYTKHCLHLCAFKLITTTYMHLRFILHTGAHLHMHSAQSNCMS